MLERLLDLLATGGVHTSAELAARLGVSDGLLDQMLTDLSRMGYLRQVGDTACAPSSAAPSSRCGGCPLVGGCAVVAGQSSGRIWALTDKILRQNPRN